ncbi:dTMP kinase [Lactococcus termiticola]|uniref:Thymidylate kinase n=1 Tax=Lactococcus termiticola TaxID=2169526 RepID=A0A2R5HJ27_9LACT|nr:dTMP kinase [Lactococcus termiticola]GBG96478.1 thymidylate kinase [Lactococcus termiticola]
MNGILISLEGPDGAGKSTALENILPALGEGQRELVTTREPGGVPVAEMIRDIILDVKHTNIDSKTELLLFEAARRVHMQTKLTPALEAGKLVLVDRFIDSSVAYQGYGRDLGLGVVDWLNDFATDGLKPDLTLYYDIDTDVALKRIMKNRADEVNRLDLERAEMHRKVREGYLAAIEAEPARFIKIDASMSPEAVAEASIVAIKERFPDNF